MPENSSASRANQENSFSATMASTVASTQAGVWAGSSEMKMLPMKTMTLGLLSCSSNALVKPCQVPDWVIAGSASGSGAPAWRSSK